MSAANQRTGTPQISVVVSTRDRAERLPALLGSLAQQTLDASSFEVVVVDNGSLDSTRELLAREQASSPFALRMLERPRGEGPAAARNQGVEAAKATLIAFTDDDCVATPGWLEAGVNSLDDADLVQGSVRPDPAVQPGPFDRTLWVDHETGLYETASLFVRRETFAGVGGFEPLFPSELERVIGEDVWFGWRARRAGARTGFCDAARVHHAVIARSPFELIQERRRLRYFPAIAKRVPELREQTFFGRLFLSSRSARFDLALASLLAGVRSRSLWPLLGTLPYAGTLAPRALRRGSRAPLVAATELGADLVGLASLVQGSIDSRTPLL